MFSKMKWFFKKVNKNEKKSDRYTWLIDDDRINQVDYVTYDEEKK
jgi:hypothetical protein